MSNTNNYVNSDGSDVGDDILVPYMFEKAFKDAKMPININDHNHNKHLYIQNETDFENIKFRIFRNFKGSNKFESISDVEVESSDKKCFAYGSIPAGRSVVAIETNQQLALKLCWEVKNSSNNSPNVISVTDTRSRSARGGLLYQTNPIALSEQESGNFYLNSTVDGRLYLTDAPGERRPQTVRIVKNPKSRDIPNDVRIWYELVNYVKVVNENTGLSNTQIVSVMGPLYVLAPTYNLVLELQNTYTLELDKCPPTYQGSTNPSIKDEFIFGSTGVFGPGSVITILYKDIQKNETRLLTNPIIRMTVTVNYQSEREGLDDTEETL